MKASCKHTKGPWTMAPATEINIQIVHFDGRNVKVIATVHASEGEAEEVFANAAMITTVPDFHALATHIISMADDANLKEHPEWHEIVKEARAAIAKTKVEPE